MTIRHHLSDPLLMAYAAGSLPEAFGLVVATHVSLCDECRARMDSFDAVGGAVVESAESVAMSEGCLEAVMARLGGQQTRPKLAERGSVPAPLADYIGSDFAKVK